jgi:hypothetical protein
MERLVPGEVEYSAFWIRYYFCRNELDLEEKKRKELLKGGFSISTDSLRVSPFNMTNHCFQGLLLTRKRLDGMRTIPKKRMTTTTTTKMEPRTKLKRKNCPKRPLYQRHLPIRCSRSQIKINPNQRLRWKYLTVKPAMISSLELLANPQAVRQRLRLVFELN